MVQILYMVACLNEVINKITLVLMFADMILGLFDHWLNQLLVYIHQLLEFKQQIFS